MNINEAYFKFLEKVNKNYTNDNISVDKGRFTLIYNEAQNKFVEWILEKRNEDDIRDIQSLLVTDEKLTFKEKILNHADYNIPELFFSFSNIQIFAKKDTCENIKMISHEIKSENSEELLFDDSNKPSFKYRETFYKLSSNLINIYIDEFDISDAYLTYYRYPVQVDIKGYTKADGNSSTDINPEFDDKIINRILTICAKDFETNNENINKVQLEKDRTISRI